MAMQWQDYYALGIPLIDNQHRELIKRIASLKIAMNTHQMYHELAQALKFVVDYTQYHFRSEEEILRENEYVHLSHHLNLHADLIGKVTAILGNLRRGKHLLPSQFIDFLENWVFQHILDEDKKFGLFLAKQSDQTAGPNPSSMADQKCADLTAAMKALGLKFKDHSKIDFANERALLLEDFIQINQADSRTEIKKFLNYLESLGREDLITQEEAKLYRSRLFKSHLLAPELRRRRRLETKLSYLDTVMEDGLITAEEYEAQRDSLKGK
jgi:hemerythrin-like metal-binding protein